MRLERCADRIGIIHAGRMRFEGSLGDLRSQVRRVTFTEPSGPWSPQFELWNEREVDAKLTRIYRASPEAWSEWESNPAVTVERISLEDIFIACVGSKRLEL